MKVLVALSGGVDSSVAAAELLAAGHDVVGITMRLWGGESDTGCCSIADVDDARRVAQQLGIDHLVFNFTDDFDQHVVQPYVDAHRVGLTPNPCIECNRTSSSIALPSVRICWGSTRSRRGTTRRSCSAMGSTSSAAVTTPPRIRATSCTC